MRLAAIILIVVTALVSLFGSQALFVVDETQLAVVTRFGEPKRSLKTPGLYSKVPFMDTITYFEKRLLLFDAPLDSLLTMDKKRLIIDVYARGKIVELLTFFEKLRSETVAASRAVDIISSELRREIASDNQSDIITGKREEIMNRIRDAVAPKLLEFGIAVVDIRIKRADFPEEIAESVYARMKAERQRKADRERAEGAEVDAQVRANVDKQATIIRAEADRDANIIRGSGEADAIKIFADALNKGPEFYNFQRSLEAYVNILASNPNTTVILPPDSDLLQFLQSPQGNSKK